MTPPGGRSISVRVLEVSGTTKASRASARGPKVVKVSVSGTATGTSFMLCTARSARPSATASRSASMKTPLPVTGADLSMSPWVWTVTSSTCTDESICCNWRATHRACVIASGLPRVAIRSGTDMEILGQAAVLGPLI